MGSDGEFEFRRQELAHMSGCEEEDIGDEEVMQSYKERQGKGRDGRLDVHWLVVSNMNGLFSIICLLDNPSD